MKQEPYLVRVIYGTHCVATSKDSTLLQGETPPVTATRISHKWKNRAERNGPVGEVEYCRHDDIFCSFVRQSPDKSSNR